MIKWMVEIVDDLFSRRIDGYWDLRSVGRGGV
jgi:hypothetical protein